MLVSYTHLIKLAAALAAHSGTKPLPYRTHPSHAEPQFNVHEEINSDISFCLGVTGLECLQHLFSAKADMTRKEKNKT